MRKQLPLLLILAFFSCLLAVALFLLLSPPESLTWRIEALVADIKYALKPPEEVIFVPTEGLAATFSPVAPAPELPTETRLAPALTPSETLLPSETSTQTPTPTWTPTPLPAQAKLTGILHQYQMWNNCGPANLAMALSFWDWRGDQRHTAAFLKPNKMDKNVMPYEMVSFVEQETDLEAAVRVGGDPELLKAFISAGYPVLVEKGFEGTGFDGWMGHYQVVNGFDDTKQRFIVQDSYKGPDLEIPYAEFIAQWRAFNYTYIIIYPADRKDQVLAILSLQAYDNFNNRYALQKAIDEIARLTGRDLYFVLFNQGSSQVALNDYASAAAAYDAAFANYALIPEEQRPWRMLWYQTGPYFAYYYTGRYQDLINLTTTTLATMADPILEESFYWRAMARLALADNEGAIQDLRQCLDVHKEFIPCVDQLKTLGEEP